MTPARLLVLAHGHQGHWFDDPQPLGQAPAEEIRLSAWQKERDWFGTHGCCAQYQGFHVLFGFSDAVVHYPEGRGRQATGTAQTTKRG